MNKHKIRKLKWNLKKLKGLVLYFIQFFLKGDTLSMSNKHRSRSKSFQRTHKKKKKKKKFSKELILMFNDFINWGKI